jgi:hypothetical protein
MSLKSWVTEIPKKEIVPLSYYYSSESESCKAFSDYKGEEERRAYQLMVVFFFIKLQTCAADLSNIQLEDLSKPKVCCFLCLCLSVSLSLCLCEVSGNFPTNKKLSINH